MIEAQHRLSLVFPTAMIMPGKEKVFRFKEKLYLSKMEIKGKIKKINKS